VDELEIGLAADDRRQVPPPSVLVEEDHQLNAERKAGDAGEDERPTRSVGERDEGDDRGPCGDQQAGHDVVR
jgi:hypothetical protein